jgi:hypothetical protein
MRETIRFEQTGPNRLWLASEQADCDSGVHTIVLRKPKFLGVWADMYYFNTEEFWFLFGKRYVAFKWILD